MILNGLSLTFFKLQPILGTSILAPLGISYFTFMLISYNLDLYWNRRIPCWSLPKFLLCVAYLPHLYIGPIDRIDRLEAAMTEERRVSWDGISAGILRMLWGLFKKFVIAARAGVIVSAVSADPSVYSGGYALLAMVLYSFQLYADFSGGIDLVLGFSRILGITLGENFDTPYASESFREFWRRWHITLGAWLRDYIYIPLGGGRKGKVRKVLNTLITFLVSGLWHGVHYVLWGLINGILVCFGDRLKTPWKAVNRVLMFLAVSLLWSFFIWPDTMTALKMAGSVFVTFNYGAVAAGIGGLGLVTGEWVVLLAGIVLLLGCDSCLGRLREKFLTLVPAARTAVICTLVLTVLVFGMYGIGFHAEEFIYSRF